MKLLIADDDVFFRKLLERILAPSYELLTAKDGGEAWQLFKQPDSARLAVLDWVMPTFSGPNLCGKIRESSDLRSMHLVILTAKDSSALTSALRAGADDYVTKPFDAEELRAKIRVGQRIVDLQTALAERAVGLENAVSQARELRALLPACPNCGKLRADGNIGTNSKGTWPGIPSNVRTAESARTVCNRYFNPGFELTGGS